MSRFKLLVLSLLLAFNLSPIFAESNPVASPIEIRDPWIREAPPQARALAGFMKLHNPTAAPITLTGVSAEAFGAVMLHRTVLDGGMAKMVHQHSISISAHSTLSFEPSGYHLMLMKPKQPVLAGEGYTLTLSYADGSRQKALYRVRKGEVGGHTPMPMH